MIVPATRAAPDTSFELVFEGAPIGMAIVAPDGRWLRVNPAMCAVLGRSEADLLAGAFQDVTHPDDLDADLEHLRRLAAGEIDRYEMEKRYVRPTGEHVWATLSVSVLRRADGSPEHYIAQVTDIDARKRMEAMLARREREYRHITEQSGDLLSRHAADGTILFASAASRAMLGREP